jgi:glycosyltransferase involved in cell wall biosynthesis
MFPNPHTMSTKAVSGIHTVVRAYARVFPEYNMELVHPDAGADVVVTHAGMAHNYADISMLHGIYFTDDYRASVNEWRANAHVVRSAVRARFITVPSEWVAETIRRDFRREPVVVPHGIFADEWVHSYPIVEKSVLWAKNRDFDVCDPTDLAVIAINMPDFNFVTTFYSGHPPANVSVIGVQPTDRMKTLIQKSSMVISTINETWGILYAEAMAAGTPVVAANWGHVPNLVPHGVAGYIYNRRDTQDAINGIEWVERHRATLSKNASVLARELRWQQAAERVRELAEVVVYERSKGLL